MSAGFALALPAKDTHDGWAALGLFATLLVAGVFAVLVGLGTNLLMPLAARHAWVRITVWVLGAVPVLAGISLMAAWGPRAAN